MNVSEAIRARRSIRKYVPGAQIPREHVEKLLEAAMLAPSACNTRPWEFVVLESQSIKEAFAQSHPYARHLASASLGIVVCARPELQDGIATGFWPQDCGAAIENLLLEAVALGYGGCWCGIYPNESRAKLFQNLLNVKSLPLAVITLGVPAESPAPRGHYDPTRVKYI